MERIHPRRLEQSNIKKAHRIKHLTTDQQKTRYDASAEKQCYQGLKISFIFFLDLAFL